MSVEKCEKKLKWRRNKYCRSINSFLSDCSGYDVSTDELLKLFESVCSTQPSFSFNSINTTQRIGIIVSFSSLLYWLLLETVGGEATEIMFESLDSIDIDDRFSTLFVPMRVTDENLLTDFLSKIKTEKLTKSLLNVIDTNKYRLLIGLYCGWEKKCMKLIDRVIKNTIKQ